jgi:hypothetical protein
MSKDKEKAALAAHVRRWQTYGPELERLRAEALHAQSEEEHQRAISDVLTGPIEWFLQGSRPDSGLVEQQRIFARVRDQMTSGRVISEV